MNTSALERFLRYVTFDTRSDEQSSTFPSTPGQLVLLRALTAELEELGLTDVVMDDHGYVMATVPATVGCEQAPAIGFLAHVDTSPEMPGHDVRPIVPSGTTGATSCCPTIRPRFFEPLTILR